MKQQSFIICFLASLAFGCEVSHPVDPEIVDCKIAGGTWKNSKCICPPDIAASTNQTVCRDGKIYTCSNGLLNLVTQCPGECSDNGKLCNLETGGDGDVCYSDKDEQTSLGYLYSCEDGKCELKTICPLGCNDEVGHENECKKCEDKSVMCQGEYLKTCINGYWDSGVKCLNGCDKEQKICNSKEGYSSETTKCDGDYLETYYVYQNNQLELKERKYCDNGCSVNNGVAECISCEPDELACDGNVLKICNENNVWVEKETCPWKCTGRACTCETNQTKCENNTLYICNDGYQTQISCPWGCEDDKCKCDETERKIKCNGNILFTCEYGNVIETYCASGCENGACNTTGSEPIETCDESIDTIKCEDDSISRYCKNGNWQDYRMKDTPLCIFNDSSSKFISYRCENGELMGTPCEYGCNKITQVCNNCNNYSDESIQCDNSRVIQYCEDGDWKVFDTGSSTICMPSNEQNIYKLYKCNDETAEEFITCEYGCSHDKDDCNYDFECVSTEPTSTCSSDKILITCNGAGSADVTVCDICVVMKNNIATCVNYDNPYTYLEWYTLVQNDEDKLSDLNSLMIDAYMEACEDPANLKGFNINFDNISIPEGYEVYTVVLELLKDNQSHYIAIKKDKGGCQYRILDLEQDEKEETWTSDRVCKNHEGDDKDENLLAKLSNFYHCYDRLDYKACIESNTGNKVNLTEILEKIKIKYTSNSQFAFSETNNFDSCP